MLPPQAVLVLHSKRANHVTRLWKLLLTNQIEQGDITESGWSSDGSPKWVDEIFPREVEEICDATYNSKKAEDGQDEISDDEWDEDKEAEDDDDYDTDLEQN